MTNHNQVFLSYSRKDLEAAASLRAQFEKCGLYVFKDDESIREGDLWLNRLQEAVVACTGFVVLVGRDGVGRWIGAETQTALSRHFAPHDDAERLPIFPVLLGDTAPETLPAFLRLFQATPWNGSDPLPERLLDQIRDRTIVPSEAAVFEGCPFVGLDAFSIDQARFFFGRHKETLDALACFDTRPGSSTVRWLEINGNSGSGKSSLMNAGLLPLIDQGWLWPRTGYEHWRRIGPLMPGEHPVGMLAETLARFSRDALTEPVEKAAVRPLLEAGDHGLADWLRGRKRENTGFLLAVDQLEELFTFADPDERKRFDRLLATALEDADCPLFLISTVRADFLDRFEDLPRLVSVRNRFGRAWTLPPIGADGLREVIDGPARLAGLNADEVRDAIIADARDEAGALPLVENALHWLWERRTGARLSGEQFHHEGGLAGILSRSADGLLDGLATVLKERALDLLFRLVKVDPEGRRHTRRRMPLAAAVEIAGGGEQGRGLVDHLAGRRTRDGAQANGPLRLITVTEEASGLGEAVAGGPWVNLIHETLIRSKSADAEGKPRPYWPTLWDYVERHKAEAVSREADSLLALKLAWQIEQAAAEWDAGGRDDRNRWSEKRIQEAIREMVRMGRVPSDFAESRTARAFLGPTDPEEIAMLLTLGEDHNAAWGSGRYGDAWRLPLCHEARARLGDRLACRRDARPGVGVREDGTPDVDWVAIPKGEIEIVRDTGNSRPRGLRKWLPGFLRAEVWGAEPDRLEIRPFHMSRYPVTNAQFQAFIDAADGYQSPDWWQDMPADAMDGPKTPRWPEPNRSRETVSWYEAVAFCRWLSDRLGFAVRLPTEHEWQHAATGGVLRNVYPWGPEWDDGPCNTAESGLERTVAVGLYPGAAPVPKACSTSPAIFGNGARASTPRRRIRLSMIRKSLAWCADARLDLLPSYRGVQRGCGPQTKRPSRCSRSPQESA